MGDASEDLTQAAKLPEGDIIRILLEQHAQIKTLFREVSDATGDRRSELFDELRTLLAVHETAEEMVLRPMAKAFTGDSEVEARNAEEKKANVMLAHLEDISVESADFDQEFAALKLAVDDHAEAEEMQEFPIVLDRMSAEKRHDLGARLTMVEKIVPTHAHPGMAGSLPKQMLAGPFASLVDRVKDALASHSHG